VANQSEKRDVSHPLPARPFRRAAGSLDLFSAKSSTPHINNEAAPGIPVDVIGWIVDTENEALTHAWLDLAGVPIPLALDRMRDDGARSLITTNRDGIGFGFQQTIVIPEAVPPGIYDARVLGRTRNGGGVYAENVQRVRIAQPRCAPLPFIAPDAPTAPDIRVNDTQLASHTMGRGAFTIRQESSLRLSGSIVGARNLHAVASSPANAAVAWDIPSDAGGRFDAALWTGDLERGLYDVTLCSRDHADRLLAVATCSIEIAGPHYVPPLHLTDLLSVPLGSVTRFADGGPRASTDAPPLLVAGRPIALAGWCLDPAATAPPLAVYVAIDGSRPIPLSHRLRDPRSNADPESPRCGFGGIVDTTRLEPGDHRIRTLAAAVSGAGWYVIDERTISLHDHRVARPS
jgi:hypothetical protein